jgi:hypothetical protein
MSKLLSDQDYKVTGVPLMTKLVAEFFESGIREFFKEPAKDCVAFIADLEKETFNLVKLYDHFVEKKLQIYYEEKCRMILTNPEAQRMIEDGKQKTLKSFETLAVQQILKTDAGKYFSRFAAIKINGDDLVDLTKVGLIYTVNKDWKFVHQTIGEFGFNRFLSDHFDDENCAKFITEVILVDPSYQIIRSFMDFWVLEKVNEKTCAIYQEKLLGSSVQNKETPLHVAAKEGNGNIFCFLYRSLATKTEDFESKRLEIENYLLKQGDRKRGHYSCIAFADYLRNCDDSFDILSKIKSDSGLGFLKKILFPDHGDHLLLEISYSDRNIVKVFIFLCKTFSNDLKFLGEVFSFSCFSYSFRGQPFNFQKAHGKKIPAILARNYFQLNFSCHNGRKFFELFGRDSFVLKGN